MRQGSRNKAIQGLFSSHEARQFDKLCLDKGWRKSTVIWSTVCKLMIKLGYLKKDHFKKKDAQEPTKKA